MNKFEWQKLSKTCKPKSNEQVLTYSKLCGLCIANWFEDQFIDSTNHWLYSLDENFPVYWKFVELPKENA